MPSLAPYYALAFTKQTTVSEVILYYNLQDVTEDEDFLGEGGDKLAQPKEEEDEKDKSDPSALLGSHRDLYGDQNNLLASQFELHSQVSKKHQMVLLEVCVTLLKVDTFKA